MKSWIVIPAMGVASALAALALGHAAVPTIAVGLAGAALAATIRALAGDSPASLSAAALAPLLAVALLAEHAHVTPRAGLALAAAAWTIVLLSRTTTSPLVAMLPATIAAFLDPAAVALVPIAGTRLVTAPWQRPAWVAAVPIVGGLGVVLAVIAGTAEHGALADLARHWYGGAPHALGVPAFAHLVGDALGPLVAVAAIAGLGLVARLRLAELALVSCVAGALLVDARAGAIGATTLGLAALCAALAIGRFAATIRLTSLQAVAGATAGVLLLVPPAWTVIELAR